jgi:hypothetical protein
MKKLFITFSFVAATFMSAFAQDEAPAATDGPIMSKRGRAILPEAGDIGLSIEAAPVLNYFGDLLSNSGATPFTFNSPFNGSIVGRYFLDEKTAVRGIVRIGKGSFKDVEFVNDVTSTATPPAQVEDVEKVSYTNITLGGGLEMRRGNGRVQGFYGAQALIGLEGNKTKYEYGNALTATNTAHTSSFGQLAGVTENKSGSIFTFGVQGFIGVEYFFAPKISIGGEFAWGPVIESEGKGELTRETWNFGTNAKETTTTETAGGSAFILDVVNTAINLNFYF